MTQWGVMMDPPQRCTPRNRRLTTQGHAPRTPCCCCCCCRPPGSLPETAVLLPQSEDKIVSVRLAETWLVYLDGWFSISCLEDEFHLRFEIWYDLIDLIILAYKDVRLIKGYILAYLMLLSELFHVSNDKSVIQWKHIPILSKYTSMATCLRTKST